MVDDLDQSRSCPDRHGHVDFEMAYKNKHVVEGYATTGNRFTFYGQFDNPADEYWDFSFMFSHLLDSAALPMDQV